MFRAAEAIMKYFDGYYQMHITYDIARYLVGKYYAIRKRNKLGIPVYNYHLVNWEFIASYFNVLDCDEVRNIYSIERFKNNEFKAIRKSKPNYGVCFN